MFGAGVIGNQENVPQWIMDLVSEVEQEYGFCLDAVYFKEPKSLYYGACYNNHNPNIQLYFGREKTDLRVWLVLHELAHAIQYLVYRGTITKRNPGRKNRVVHNDVFFAIARKLFIKYGVIETAAKREYKRARKLMVA